MPTLTAIYEATLMAFRRAEGVEFESVGIIDDFSGLLAVPTLLRVSADPSSGGGRMLPSAPLGGQAIAGTLPFTRSSAGPPSMSAFVSPPQCQVLSGSGLGPTESGTASEC
jgi:hypothetical protein